jgi:hypothetical protein
LIAAREWPLVWQIDEAGLTLFPPGQPLEQNAQTLIQHGRAGAESASSTQEMYMRVRTMIIFAGLVGVISAPALGQNSTDNTSTKMQPSTQDPNNPAKPYVEIPGTNNSNDNGATGSVNGNANTGGANTGGNAAGNAPGGNTGNGGAGGGAGAGGAGTGGGGTGSGNQ